MNNSNLDQLLQSYREDNSQETFWAIYNLRKDSLKLTGPQKEVIRELKNGSVIVLVNEHHRSGGQWTWNTTQGGTIYKPFWGAMDKILAGTQHTRIPKGFILSVKEFKLLDR